MILHNKPQKCSGKKKIKWLMKGLTKWGRKGLNIYIYI